MHRDLDQHELVEVMFPLDRNRKLPPILDFAVCKLENNTSTFLYF